MGILQARVLEWVAMPSFRGSSQLRDGLRSPAFQVDSLPSEPPGKPMLGKLGKFYKGLWVYVTEYVSM